MVKMTLLDDNAPYRVVLPIIAPETKTNAKKGKAYVVLAPSIKAELEFLSNVSCPIKFRHLYKYFIDKRIQMTLYGQGSRIVTPNSNGDITELFSFYSKGNLGKVDGITSYLRSSKSRPLKDLNVLFETNHLFELIMNNPKDKRLISYKASDYTRALCGTLDVMAGENNILSNRIPYDIELFIPMQLWFTKDQLNSPATITRYATRIPMGKILQLLLNHPTITEKVRKIYFTYNNIVMPLNLKAEMFSEMDAQTRYEAVMRLIVQFINKTKTVNATPDPTDKHDMKAAEAQKATEIEVAAEDTLKAAKIDPTEVSDETKEKLGKRALSIGVQEIKPELSIPRPAGAGIPGDASKNTPQINAIDTNLEKLQQKEVIKVPPVADAAAEDDILNANLENKSIKSYKRDEELKKKYTTLKLGDTTLDKIVEDEKQYDIPKQETRANVVNENMKSISAAKFDETYNKNLADKDLISILLHFRNAKPALYLNKDIKVEDISTPTDRILRYTVEYEDETRKRHRFSFQMPKMYQEKYLYLNDQKMNLLHQKFPFPVTKTEPGKCQAVTNYKKIFTERYGKNLSPRVTRLVKLLTSPGCPSIVKTTTGDCLAINKEWMTTVEYDEIASSIVRLDIGRGSNVINIFFSLSEAAAVINPSLAPKIKDKAETQPLLPLARERISGTTRYYFTSSTTNKVYNDAGEMKGELSNFIIGTMVAYDPKTEEDFANTSIGSKFVFARSAIMDENIPTIVMLAAADPDGLTGVLEKAGIDYQFVQKRTDIERTENADDQGIIQFEDGFLVFDRYPFENSLLMNGLYEVHTKEYSFYDMNTRDTYAEIFNDMYGKRKLVDALQNFYYMFIDPITIDVLNRLKMPTDFTRLLLYCVGVLADNNYQLDSDYHNSRIRSNEIIYAHLYQHLSEAWGKWRTGRAEKFSIREDAIIKELLTSNVVDPHSELNPLLEAENDRQIKLQGPSGMNQTRAFKKLEKRAYHESMKGIVGMNTAPSGEVGINRHLVLNPNIVDARGFIKVDSGKEDFDGSSLITPAELMQTFGPEAADNERLLMSISQSKHFVPVEHEVACPVSYDMERVMPYLSNDYARTAKQDGEVVAIENNLMIIKYKDGTMDDVDLSERPAKNTDGGFYIMNKMESKLQVGSKVKAGQIVAYDPKYFNDKDMFGDPLATMGTMARVAVETNGGVYEDACYITDDLAHRMKTKITRQKRVILSRFANIKYIVKIGQHLKANDPILTFDDTEDEFSSQMLAKMAEEMDDVDELIAGSAPVVSKVTGVVKDIRIYYTIEPEQTTPSMRDLVDKYNKDASKRERTIKKYMNLYDANTIVKTSQKLTPNSEGKVKGVRVNDGIFIDFYIEYDDVMAPGDKLSFYSAMKGIVSDIIPFGLEPYGEVDPNHKIDACVSSIGFYRRMCLDFAKVGGLCKMVIERKRQLSEKYLEACKAELRK